MKLSNAALPASMLRQWCFCPRIIWYTQVLHLEVAYPPWVEQGGSYHQAQELLSRRRAMHYYGLDNVIRHESPMLKSEFIGVYGRPDLMLESTDEVCPVEFKSRMVHPTRGQILQLIAYGLLAEEAYGKPCHRAFFAAGKRIRIRMIQIDDGLRTKTKQAIQAIQKICNETLIPDSPADHARCCQCEYLNHCNDRF